MIIGKLIRHSANMGCCSCASVFRIARYMSKIGGVLSAMIRRHVQAPKCRLVEDRWVGAIRHAL